MKFERDVKTPRNENDVTITIFKLNDVLKILKLKNSYQTLTISFNLSCVRLFKNKTYLLLLRTLNSPLKAATLPFSK